MKTATIELPAILVSTINAFEFPGNPLWRVGQGLDHVKIELTYKLPTDQPTVSVEHAKEKPFIMPNPKRRNKRTKPAPSTGEWPRQTLPAAKPRTRQQPARHCKTPHKEQPPTECRPPTTPTLTVERPTIEKPTTKTTAPPPASPTLSLPPTTATMPNAGIIYPIDENGKLIHPDLDDLPGKPTDYDWISYDDTVNLGTDFKIVSARRYKGTDYFTMYHNSDTDEQFRFYARFDQRTCHMLLGCPVGLNIDSLPHHRPVYVHFKRIYYQKAEPTDIKLANYNNVRFYVPVAASFESG